MQHVVTGKSSCCHFIYFARNRTDFWMEWNLTRKYIYFFSIFTALSDKKLLLEVF